MTDQEQDNMHVDPFKVLGNVDYLKLINKFNTKPIEETLLKRWVEITKLPLHPMFRRGLVFSHRDLELILNAKEKGEPIYIYTGRGPSSDSMHLGHLIPFQLTKYLQDALDAFVIIQMSDDEKYFFKEGDLNEFNDLCYKNAKDIISVGFDLNKTLIFSNLEHMNGKLYYNNAVIMRNINGNTIKSIFGLSLDNNLGQLVWPAFQSGPAFSTSFPDIFGEKPIYCLVSMAIDQDPYFRMARDVADKLKSPKPAVIHSQFLPSLSGPNSKMSSSDKSLNNATLFLDMDKKQVVDNIKKHAYSGGRDTLEDHRKYGGDISRDVSYQYLTYFLDDDEKLKEIAENYTSGKMTSGEIKQITADIVWQVISNHQSNKNNLSDENVKEYFNRNRKFDLQGETEYKIKNKVDQNYIDNLDQSKKLGMNFDLTFGFSCIKI